ncbi:histidinol-phosphate transaminase [Actinomarinicola tropica]|uniref:Histidinol-phosphate aminotransferase n=1 Tax=Actinomarinicola tropica TaxID=2789776 RepID=A0A5Q2RLQ4_9ACTN|nr:histidinol-phosphate transaminase [Actinomarinicola tropica]QGG95511.1 histidinol-phosphate transaminase [Actinomarinicola tropica]
MRPAPRDDVVAMEGYHSPQVDVDVRLNTNESPLGPPASFVAELTDAIAGVEWHRYPDRAARDLRAAIGSLHGRGHEQVFAANGSNEVLQSLCLAYGGPGRRAVTFEPTYALHGHIARVTGTEVVSAPRRDDFTLDLDVVRRTLESAQPTLTFLCSPNNPTGLVEPQEVVETVVEVATSLGSLVVVDEAYGQFAPWSAASLLDEELPLVVTRTYSKTWAMAAARLGYALAPTWVVDELEKVVLPYHLDAVTQLAGTLAVGHLAEMEARVAQLVEERGRLVAELAQLPVTVWPSGANFVLFRPDARAGDEVWKLLVERSVLVRNCASWPGLDDCLRVTIGTRDEDDAFLAALREILT